MLRGIDAEASVGVALDRLARVVFQVNKECGRGYHTIDSVRALWCVNDFFVAKRQWYDRASVTSLSMMRRIEHVANEERKDSTHHGSSRGNMEDTDGFRTTGYGREHADSLKIVVLSIMAMGKHTWRV